MDWRLALVVGAALGAFATAALTWTAPPDDTVLADAAAPVHRDDPGPRTVSRTVSGTARAATAIDPTANADCDTVLEARDFEIELLRGQLAALGGAPTPWPADLAAAFSADAVEAWLDADDTQRTVAELGEVHSLECTEYPCLLTVHYRDGMSASTAHASGLHTAIQAHAGEPIHHGGNLLGLDDDTYYIVPIAPQGALGDSLVNKRVQVRSEAIMDTLDD